MSKTNHAFAIQEVDFHYTHQQEKTLKNVSFTIPKNQLTALIGPNGSGKSTLFHCLTGEYTPEKGSILYEEKSIYELKGKERAQKIAVVYQSNQVDPQMKVKDLVSMGRTPYKKILQASTPYDHHAVQSALEKVELTELADQSMGELSGGQKQRVWLALALAQEPEVLLLDEPTTYLDVRNQLLFLRIIKKLLVEENLTVCMILHDLNQVLRYANKTCVLKEGQLVSEGETKHVLTKSLIEEVYGIHATLYQQGNGETLIDIY